MKTATNFRKRLLWLAAILPLLLTSCRPSLFLPQAVNTMNTASLDALNLQRKDYEILNTITAESIVVFKYSFDYKSFTIKCPNDDFSIRYEKGKKGWEGKYDGVLRLGFFANDYLHLMPHEIVTPDYVVRGLALYRAVNTAQQYGADAVIEPTIATNIEREGNREFVFKTTVTAKLIKFKTDN
ncbi:MAG: hypothetical protein NC324_05805 [Bacteroides sp.]|nr:hypothetical protein [Bacteroides sp.]